MIGFKEKKIARALKNVSIRKELLIKFLDEIDADDNGYIDLAEAGEALVFLWRKAKGKLKKPKQITLE